MECGMERRFHRGFTAAEKTELWDRWKRGESLKAIGRAFGCISGAMSLMVSVTFGAVSPSISWPMVARASNADQDVSFDAQASMLAQQGAEIDVVRDTLCLISPETTKCVAFGSLTMLRAWRGDDTA
jgi:hypothetical protein